MSKKWVLILIVLGAIAVPGIIVAFSKSSDEEAIKADPEQTIGTVVEHDNLNEYNTNGCWIYYEYTVDGKKYKHSQKYHGCVKEDNFFQSFKFPVIYSRNDPDKARILIISDEYETFGVVQPDSLKRYNGRIL